MSVHAGKRWVWNTACQNNPGNEPPFGKILAYDSRIEGIYVNGTARLFGGEWVVEDKFVTPALMTRIRSFGLLAGAWFVPRSGSAIAEARNCANMVTALNPDCVLLDIETHDLNFQRAFVAEYRRLKPGRATDVTFEPRQGPDSVAVREYLDARFDLVPQLYNGQMRTSDPKHEIATWSAAGVPLERLHFFYDARLDLWSMDEGYWFTAETLPDKRRFVKQAASNPAFVKVYHDTIARGLEPVEPCGEEPYEEAA